MEKKHLSGIDTDRIIEMAWEDKTPFEAIFNQFGLNENEVKQLMKKELLAKNYKRWRDRVTSKRLKHVKKRTTAMQRFKSKAQRMISGNKRSKAFA